MQNQKWSARGRGSGARSHHQGQALWVELMDIGKIFIQQYLMKKSKLEEKKHFSAFLASSFIDTNPQTILKCLILMTSPIHLGYTCFNHLLQQNKGKMYGGGTSINDIRVF